MKEFKAEVTVEVDTEDPLIAEQTLREQLEEAEHHPHCSIEGFRLGDVVNLEAFNQEPELCFKTKAGDSRDD